MISTATVLRQLELWRSFTARELKTRYLGSISGAAWVFIHPAVLLLLYSFLLTVVFQTRMQGVAAQQVVAHVAIGLWPWLMFSEGLQRATGSLQENSPLLGKVSVPSHLLVLASLSATFLLHCVGYLFVIALMAGLDMGIELSGVVVVLPLLIMLFGLCAGLVLMLAPLQIFVRDLAQVLAQVLAFMFFLTPVLYGKSQLPEGMHFWMSLNPLSFYIEHARTALLTGEHGPEPGGVLLALLLVALSLALGIGLFRRLRGHLEDFL